MRGGGSGVGRGVGGRSQTGLFKEGCRDGSGGTTCGVHGDGFSQSKRRGEEKCTIKSK